MKDTLQDYSRIRQETSEGDLQHEVLPHASDRIAECDYIYGVMGTRANATGD